MGQRIDSRGSMIVELIVAVLILAVAVAVMLGGMLQSAGNKVRVQDKEMGTIFLNQLLQSLGNYVTADPSDVTKDRAPNCCWNFLPPGTTACGAPANCPAGSGWALDEAYPAAGACAAAGCHDVSAVFLPAELRAPPHNATLIYTVTINPLTGLRDVGADLKWTETLP
jgi:hypothetical protein